jgi:lipopolysaccharide export system protein LptA
MTRRDPIFRIAACTAIAFALSLASAVAQQGVPNALQGFSQNKDKPVQIEAASLEVRDKDKIATFSGDVNVTQGDTNMKCKSLLVFYDQDNKTSAGMKSAQPGPGGSSSIKRLEAKGGVIVTQKDQIATGETGIFDMKSNTITLAGKVTVTQGQNILRGDRLVVDITTGAARVESGGGRVQGLFVPSSSEGKPAAGKDKDKDKDKDAGKEKDTGKDKDSGKGKNAAKPKDAGKDTKKEEEPAPARAPATRDVGTAPDRPVAPRGIY